MSRVEAAALLAELHLLGIEITVQEKKLRCRPRTLVTAKVQERVQASRAELIDLLEPACPEASCDSASALPSLPCYCCGSREYVRVLHGPEWICVTCHGPRDPRWIERYTPPTSPGGVRPSSNSSSTDGGRP